MAKKAATRTKVVPIMASDSLHNLLSGMGGGGDKTTGVRWHYNIMPKEQLESAYRGDWIARKVVDIPALDAVRSWRDWQAEKDDITKLEEFERKVNLKGKMKDVLQKARLYGGAALILGIDQGKPEDPVDLKKIKKDGLKFIHVVSRYELAPGQLITDIESEWYNEPEYYTRNVVGDAGQLKLHPSRVVRMFGLEPADIKQSQGWGDPVLQVVADAIRAAGTVANGIAQLVDEAKIDVIKIPGLTENIMDAKYEARIRKRFGLASDAKSIYKMLLLDGEEEWNRITQNFATLPDILQMYMVIASGAADIPVTRMMGEAPKGLHATGAADIRNYYDMVNTKQTMEIGPPLDRLDKVMIRSVLGADPESIHYTWVPLWQLDETQIADMALKKAQTHKIDVDNGLIEPEILKQARENQLIEDGTYPGLETIIEDYEAAVEAGLIIEQPDPVPPALGPDGQPLPVDPNAPPKPPGPANSNTPPKPPAAGAAPVAAPKPAKPSMPLRRAAAKTGTNDRMVRRIRDASVHVDDAQPRTLYVRRNVLNWQDIAKHFKKQGFPTTTGEGMHVTIAYSKIPLDWMKIPESWNGDKDGNLTINPGGVRIVEKFDDNATVLLFQSSELQWRWRDIKDAGANWKWPDYQPHITITLDGPADISKVQPYTGKIVLGPEIFEETNTDWAENVIEDSKAELLWAGKPRMVVDAVSSTDKLVGELVKVLKDAPAPVINVTVPITMPKGGKEVTKVTKHDAKGRIVEYERSTEEE
jgi:phage-related protein (TIGR01555 family)